MSIRYRVVLVYPVVKALKFLKYRRGLDKIRDDLSNNELMELYEELYSKRAKSLDEAKDKLKLDDNGILVDTYTNQIFNNLTESIENTSTEIGLIESSLLPYRFSVEQKNDQIVESIYKYLKNFTVKTKQVIEQEYSKVGTTKELVKIDYKVRESSSVLKSNNIILQEESSKCIIIRITVYHYNTAYGSVLITHRPELRNNENEKYAVVEDIIKYPIPILAEMLFKEIIFPDLNQLLLPKIEEKVKKLGVNVIYTQQVDRSKDIERFGYLRTNYKWENPCEKSSISFGSKYVRYIDRDIEDIIYNITEAYSIRKSNEFLKYQEYLGKLKKNLTHGQLIELSYILYEKDVGVEKMKVDSKDVLVDPESKRRFDNLVKRTKDTKSEITSIIKYELPFRVKSGSYTNGDKVDALASYLSIPSNDVNSRYKSIDSDTDSLVRYTFSNVSSLLLSIKLILESEDSNCELFIITVYHKGYPYGIALIVYNESHLDDEGEKYIVIEYMTMYPIPALAKVLFPEHKLPDLYDLLFPKIEEIAKRLEVKAIYIDQQDEDHKVEEYGFVKTNYQWKKTCNKSIIGMGDKHVKRLSMSNCGLVKSKFFNGDVSSLTTSSMGIGNRDSLCRKASYKEGEYIEVILYSITLEEKGSSTTAAREEKGSSKTSTEDWTKPGTMVKEYNTDFIEICSIKSFYIEGLKVKKTLRYHHDLFELVQLVEYNDKTAILNAFNANGIRRSDAFSDPLCNQMEASKVKIAPRVITYGAWNNNLAFILSEYKSGDLLWNYGKVDIDIYFKALEKVTKQILRLGIIHKFLSDYTILVTENDVLIINYSKSKQISRPVNVNTKKFNEDFSAYYDWAMLSQAFINHLDKGVIVGKKLNEEDIWKDIIKSLYDKNKRTPTVKEVIDYVKKLIL